MKLINKKVEDLNPYANNPRTHSTEQIKQIVNSIKEFGFNNPVLVDEDNNVIAGHGRLLAAKDMELKKVPCIVLAHLSEAQKKAYVIADNNIALNSAWDFELLQAEMESLVGMDFDTDLLGFDVDFKFTDEHLEGEKDNPYTDKTNVPTYTPTREEKPSVEELFNVDKTHELIEKIKKAKISDEDKVFLIAAAQRHTVFNYENIAEYYAHSPKRVQQLMEQSALVIVDFKDGLKEGYVKLNDTISQHYLKDGADEDEA